MAIDFSLIGKTCRMQAARARARRLTAIYEAAFAPLELSGGQFSTLVAIGQAHKARVSELAHHVGMDSTTMSRALKPLERRNLIVLEPDPEDARARQVSLTKAGEEIVEQAIPLWESAQQTTEE